MDALCYTPRYISGRAHESDPEFYLKDQYWDGVTISVLVVKLEYGSLAGKIVLESLRRKIPVTAETSEIQQSVDQFITGAASN